MTVIKKTAALLDLGFVLPKLYERLGKRHANALQVRDFALRCLAVDEELFRIYCYHCPPYDQQETHPLTGLTINFASGKAFTGIRNLIRDLKIADNIAFRAGQLSFDGWVIKKQKAEELIKTRRPLEAADFAPDLNQKLVDMKIGLDVAWLSSKRIVDRIILVTGDSDFMPAMKFARREGVQVVLVTMGHKFIKHELLEHADELRKVKFP